MKHRLHIMTRQADRRITVVGCPMRGGIGRKSDSNKKTGEEGVYAKHEL